MLGWSLNSDGGGGVLLGKVSKGSDLLRKLLVQMSTEFPQSQFPDVGGHDPFGRWISWAREGGFQEGAWGVQSGEQAGS